jgi:hypothetical protein
MSNHMMSGVWRFMLKVPPKLWEAQIKKHRRRIREELAFMTPDHRRVHRFVVRSIPGRSEPLYPAEIADAVGIGMQALNRILADLEAHMTFLFRNEEGAVTWAYPVTVEKTPHHLTFDNGITCFAA